MLETIASRYVSRYVTDAFSMINNIRKNSTPKGSLWL